MTEVAYVLGHSRLELERLKLQAEILSGITRRLLLEAGLRKGMRVLDIGCGYGDVANLAASIVGPSGLVVSIDRSLESIEAAKARATTEGWTNIKFLHASLEDFTDEGSFDLAIERYVLVHQANPVDMVRAAAAKVKLGGVVAFHEIVSHVDGVTPISPLLNSMLTLISKAGQLAVPCSDAALVMPEFFGAAGLKDVKIFGEIPVGYGDSPIGRWVELLLQRIHPSLLQAGLVSPGELDVDTIESRLREEAAQRRRPLVMPLQLCGWARVEG